MRAEHHRGESTGDVDVLGDPARLRSLHESGLSAEADALLDEIAERVRRLLGVPVGLVSLVDPDGQSFPGQAGLPEPWSDERRTPLSHSFCRHVVVTAEPLVVVDAREDARVHENLAVPDLSVIAYAGMPLTDGDGNVLGSLCAIDDRPREWTAHELDLLAGLAAGCSAELRVRLAVVQARRERERRDLVERDLNASFDRSQSLLRASQAFTDAAGLADVRGRLGELLARTLEPSCVRVAILDGNGTYRLSDGEELPWDWSGTADGEELLVVGRQDGSDDGFSAWLAREDARVALVVRLREGGELGLMVVGWPSDPVLDAADRLYARTIAGYVARAVARVRFVERRVTVAHEMQVAMLAPLPEVPGLELVARYLPADDDEDVGGDWYDVSLLPDPDPAAGPVVAASVGDVVGHTLDSAIRMGQVRSMLRQAAWDVDGSPSEVLSAVERAVDGDDLGHAGTAVLARLRHGASGRWEMTWTNAGHPPPVVVEPSGVVRVLDGVDPLFGFPSVVRRPRTDHTVDLPDGCTVVLHTDGLIERPGEDLDEGARRLREALTLHAGLPLDRLVDAAIADVAPAAVDDVVVLAIRLGATEHA
ncbi:GAF domain-containing SpoIIE family protein phosphatase [Actinomycetospora termitidis]|uniref:SpoIIE family protein phosphatase n=1 Tax=Actinomycetospora termitidis TaxID=3053470 RepID=A0ABT7MI52_9PSEU|nr:GAF domain-containing SpoIIE family protein phosphatase [Actinomycetospora sp. Odt1-22]MDL5160336.1 SpoIIE family protein phosphatase [Actinomycetospora sp. Odt1-22]